MATAEFIDIILEYLMPNFLMIEWMIGFWVWR